MTETPPVAVTEVPKSSWCETCGSQPCSCHLGTECAYCSADLPDVENGAPAFCDWACRDQWKAEQDENRRIDHAENMDEVRR